MYRTIAIALIVLMAASTADAKLFGRRSRSNSGGGYQSFPANTPPAPANCPGGVCVNPLTVPAIAPIVLPQSELSIVVEQSTLAVTTPTIASLESDLTIFKQQVAEAEASLVRLRLVAERTAAIEAIQQRAADEVKRLSIEYTIQDLQAELPQAGGDPKDETPAE